MADEDPRATSQRVYRRKPADIAEAKFIADLINTHVEQNTVALATEKKHDELYTIMGYQKTWNEIVKDLTEQAAPIQRPVPNATPAAHTTAGDAAARSTDATTGGAQPRSNRANKPTIISAD